MYLINNNDNNYSSDLGLIMYLFQLYLIFSNAVKWAEVVLYDWKNTVVFSFKFQT